VRDERGRVRDVDAQARRRLQAGDERARQPRARAEAHDLGERHAELVGERRADEDVARREPPAGEQPIAADAARERAQAVVRVADARRAAPRVGHVGEAGRQPDRGDDERGGDRSEREVG